MNKLINGIGFRVGILLNRISRKILVKLIGGTAHELNGEMRILTNVVKEGGNNFIVLDIGANIGKWASSALTIDNRIYVYSFEIVPEFYEKLSKIDFNGRLKSYNIGLSDSDSTIQIYVSGFGAGIHKEGNQNKNFYQINCQLTHADTFILKNINEKIDFIKIDVDGMELKVLKGLSNTMERCRPIVQFEHSEYNYKEGDIFKMFFQFFASRGYKLYIVSENNIYKIDKYMKFYELFMNKNILAVPNEKVRLF
jgi:FkbM family methyltransferase